MCRVIVTDGTAAWVGSDSGNVKRIELQTKQVTGGNTRCWLEHTHTLRHVAKSRRSSNVFGSTASADLDDLSRADSARASEMSVSEEPAAGPVAARAHAGPVTAVEVHSCFVFTSGGAQSHPALHQWSASGMLQHSHKLNQIGMSHLRLCCHSACQSEQQAESLATSFADTCMYHIFFPAVHALSFSTILALFFVMHAAHKPLTQFKPICWQASLKRGSMSFNSSSIIDCHTYLTVCIWASHLVSHLAMSPPAVFWPSGVARAIKVLSSFVHVRAPINITQQRSSETGLENMDTSSLSSVGTQSPGTDNIEAVPAQRHSNWQILTAHDNGQMQVWDMSSGMLCPVLRFGAVGPAARYARHVHFPGLSYASRPDRQQKT